MRFATPGKTRLRGRVLTPFGDCWHGVQTYRRKPTPRFVYGGLVKDLRHARTQRPISMRLGHREEATSLGPDLEFLKRTCYQLKERSCRYV